MDPVRVVRRTLALVGRAPLLVGRAALLARSSAPSRRSSGPSRRSSGLLVGRAESRPRRLLAELHLQLPAHLTQLGLEVLPLTDPQVVEVLAPAHPPERARRQLALLGAQVAPEVQPGQEVGGRVLEAGVQLVRLRLLLQGPLAGVLQRERRGDDQDLADAPEPLGLQDHPAEPRVDRQPGQPPAHLGQPRPAPPVGRACRDHGAELLEQLHARRDVAPVGRLDEREATDVAEPERGHLQDDGGQVGAQDLGVGEGGPGLEVLLGVEPDRDAGLDPPAATGTLAGRRLADRLDREPLHLGLQRVARDPRQPGVDDVPDAGHGQRGLGDVGRQDDAAHRGAVGGEDAVLLGGREPGEQRHDLERATAVRPEIGQCVRGVADLALARQEDQDVAWSLAGELAYGVEDRLGLVADERLTLLVDVVGRAGRDHERSVADLDRVGAPRDLDDGRRPFGGRACRHLREVSGEPLGVDRRGGDDELEVGATRQELLEVAEQEVDVEAPLVRLVDDDRVVATQLAVALELGEQDAVGHHLDPGVRRGPVGEADLVADLRPQRRLQLGREALRDRAGRDPAGLGVPDHPAAAARAAAELETDLGQLGGLARAGLAGDDDDLVVADGRRDVVTPLADRQLGREGDVHNAGDSSPATVAAPTQLPTAAATGRLLAGNRHRDARPFTGKAQALGGP